MTTPVQQKIRDQKRTPEQIAQRVQSGDRVNHGSTGGDSTICTAVGAVIPPARSAGISRSPWEAPYGA
ncbi:MAG TPA: hypothetical protein PKY58_03060, partial [Syntrophales bacterium]|nr:hypothetical protein [Syntrophales bacterium]